MLFYCYSMHIPHGNTPADYVASSAPDLLEPYSLLKPMIVVLVSKLLHIDPLLFKSLVDFYESL